MDAQSSNVKHFQTFQTPRKRAFPSGKVFLNVWSGLPVLTGSVNFMKLSSEKHVSTFETVKNPLIVWSGVPVPIGSVLFMKSSEIGNLTLSDRQNPWLSHNAASQLAHAQSLGRWHRLHLAIRAATRSLKDEVLALLKLRFCLLKKKLFHRRSVWSRCGL